MTCVLPWCRNFILHHTAINMVKVSVVTFDAPDAGTHTVYLSVLFGVSGTALP